MKEGYELDSSQNECVEICGDGLVLYHECDDGNQINNDGCSQNCQIESGYICHENDFAPIKQSYCSKREQLHFELIETMKEIYSNNLNFTFNVNPESHKVLEKYP